MKLIREHNKHISYILFITTITLIIIISIKVKFSTSHDFLRYFFTDFKSVVGDLFILIPFPPSFREINIVFGFNLAGLTIF